MAPNEVGTKLGNSTSLVAFKDGLMFQARNMKKAALAEELKKGEYIVLKPTKNPLVFQSVNEDEWELNLLCIFRFKLSDVRYYFKSTAGKFEVGDKQACYMKGGLVVKPGWDEPSPIVSVKADW